MKMRIALSGPRQLTAPPAQVAAALPTPLMLLPVRVKANWFPARRPSLLILIRASPVDAVMKTLLKVLFWMTRVDLPASLTLAIRLVLPSVGEFWKVEFCTVRLTVEFEPAGEAPAVLCSAVPRMFWKVQLVTVTVMFAVVALPAVERPCIPKPRLPIPF